MQIRNFLWLVLLATLWAPTFLLIKVAVEEIPPLTVGVGLVGVAALLLYLILWLQGQKLPKFGPIWKHLVVMAFVQNTLPVILLTWGEQYVDSALAAILNGATPLFTIILAHVLTQDDRLTAGKLLGMHIGFGGVLVLIAPSILDGFWATSWGLIAITTAAACYSVAMVYARLYLRSLPPLVTPTAQLSLATLYLLPLALFVERPFNLPLPSLAALGALLSQAILGTAVALIIYYYLIKRTSASYVSMVTYLQPVLGAILGMGALGEQLHWTTYIGCTLILIGAMTVNNILKPIPWLQRLWLPSYGS